jgi:hypothetical protein
LNKKKISRGAPDVSANERKAQAQAEKAITIQA